MATSVLNSPLRSMIRSSSKRALSSQNRTSNNSICFRQKYSFQQSPFTPHQSKRRTHVHLPRAVPVESLQVIRLFSYSTLIIKLLLTTNFYSLSSLLHSLLLLASPSALPSIPSSICSVLKCSQKGLHGKGLSVVGF